MPHNIVNGFCESGCKVPVKPAAQVEDLQHGGTGVSVKTAAELAEVLGLMPVYTGPADIYVDPNATDEQIATGGYFRTFQAALDVLSYKAILSMVTVHLAAGMTETGTWKLEGTQVNAPYLTIISDENNRANLTGSWDLKGCHGLISVGYISMTVPADKSGIFANGNNLCIEVQHCVFRGQSATTNHGVRTTYGASSILLYDEFYNLAYACRIADTGACEIMNCKGNCSMMFGATTVALLGTMPSSKTTLSYIDMAASVSEYQVSVDQGNP